MGNSGRCVTLASMVMRDPLNVGLDRVKVQGLHNCHWCSAARNGRAAGSPMVSKSVAGRKQVSTNVDPAPSVNASVTASEGSGPSWLHLLSWLFPPLRTPEPCETGLIWDSAVAD